MKPTSLGIRRKFFFGFFSLGQAPRADKERRSFRFQVKFSAWENGRLLVREVVRRLERGNDNCMLHAADFYIAFDLGQTGNDEPSDHQQEKPAKEVEGMRGRFVGF
jgi:hypothetical protein